MVSSPSSPDAVEILRQEKTTAPYSSWKSPITADIVSGASKRLIGTAVDSRGRLVWLKSRPAESGKGVLVREGKKPGDEPTDITPNDFVVRTVTQEYEGGAFQILSDNTLVFFSEKDQRPYKQDINSKDSSPQLITLDYGAPLVTYADGVLDGRFNRYLTIREDGCEDRLNSVTTIVEINLKRETLEGPKILVSGSDFYVFPRLDPKGERLAWIQWAHPNMPWDKAELRIEYISGAGEEMI